MNRGTGRHGLTVFGKSAAWEFSLHAETRSLRFCGPIDIIMERRRCVDGCGHLILAAAVDAGGELLSSEPKGRGVPDIDARRCERTL